jgi:hypothetical protein
MVLTSGKNRGHVNRFVATPDTKDPVQHAMGGHGHGHGDEAENDPDDLAAEVLCCLSLHSKPRLKYACIDSWVWVSKMFMI